jgi:hypothetical protein
MARTFGGLVANQFFIDPGNNHPGVVLHLEGDAGWRWHLDGMAVTSTHDEGCSLDLGSGAHTNNFKGFAVAVVNAFDHVGDEGATQAVAFP